MSAAILQGVPATALDTDVWIDSPSRQCLRVIRIAFALGPRMQANAVVALSDDSLVIFVYSIGGLSSFRNEYRNAAWLEWNSMSIPVLPLARIIKSKETVAREKDLAHLPLLKKVFVAVTRSND